MHKNKFLGKISSNKMIELRTFRKMIVASFKNEFSELSQTIIGVMDAFVEEKILLLNGTKILNYLIVLGKKA